MEHVRPWWPFVRHYLEMVAVMLAGMVVLGAAVSWLAAAAGRPDLFDAPVPMTLSMAADMVVATVAWMLLRGHGRAATAEMALAMALPFVLVLPVLEPGPLSLGTALTLAHVLMLVAMGLVMLRRPREYGVPVRTVPAAGPAVP